MARSARRAPGACYRASVVVAATNLAPLRVLRRVSGALEMPGELDQRLAAAVATVVPELADHGEVELEGFDGPLGRAAAAAGAAEPAPAGPALELPLWVRGAQVGVLRLVRAAERPPWSEADQLTAEEIAARLSSAIDTDARVVAAGTMNDDLLATLSHELRTPLNVVIGWIDLLRRGRLDPDRQVRALELIERNARVQSRLVEDLLDASRAVRGRLRLVLEPVAVTEVVLAAVDALRPEAESSRVGLSLEAPHAITLSGDAERLSQVVQNLVSNAIKFTPAGGAVVVAVEALGDERVAIRVTDTGVGIDGELLPHIFDRFWQGDRRRSGGVRGLGLGLFIARHLVELHGGTISAESEGPGHGARFVVELPVR